MSAPTHAAAPETALTHSEITGIILGLLLAMLLAALDQTIVATAMPTIGHDLNDMQNLPWVVTAYLLTSTAVTPLYGKLSDIHGRRIVLLTGIVIFSLGSIACALAPTMLTLSLARGLQGLGGGGLLVMGQTIIADMVSPRERGLYQIYIAGLFTTSSLAGPVLGGFFAEHLSWTMIFWINIPLGYAAFLMTNDKLRRLPRNERPHALDLPGAALLVGATVALLLALSWGGVRYPWTSATILGLLAASAMVWGLFVARLLTAKEPLIPLSVLANPVVATGTLSACFGMGTFIGLSIYVPIYMEGVRGLSASMSGLALIPLMVGTVAGATLSGRLMMRLTHYKRVPVVGLALGVAGCAIMSGFARDMPMACVELLLAVLSIGLGTLLPVTTVSIQNAVGPHELGTATAGMNFFRSLGGAIIVAAFGTIVLSAAGGWGGGDLKQLTPEQGAALGETFRWVFAAAAICLTAALGFIAAMRELPLRGKASAPKAAAAE